MSLRRHCPPLPCTPRTRTDFYQTVIIPDSSPHHIRPATTTSVNPSVPLTTEPFSNQAASPHNLSSLPEDLLEIIASLLDLNSARQLDLTCKTIRPAAEVQIWNHVSLMLSPHYGERSLISNTDFHAEPSELAQNVFPGTEYWQGNAALSRRLEIARRATLLEDLVEKKDDRIHHIRIFRFRFMKEIDDAILRHSPEHLPATRAIGNAGWRGHRLVHPLGAKRVILPAIETPRTPAGRRKCSPVGFTSPFHSERSLTALYSDSRPRLCPGIKRIPGREGHLVALHSGAQRFVRQ